MLILRQARIQKTIEVYLRTEMQQNKSPSLETSQRPDALPGTELGGGSESENKLPVDLQIKPTLRSKLNLHTAVATLNI